jgi:hypothetical protein
MRRLWFWHRWEFVNSVSKAVFGALYLASGLIYDWGAHWLAAGTGALLLAVGGVSLIRMYANLPDTYEKDVH